MKITLTGNLDLGPEAWVMETPQITLRELLSKVEEGHKTNMPFIDPSTGALDELFVISVNDKDCRYLPQHIYTELVEGDTVDIMVLGLGGG